MNKCEKLFYLLNSLCVYETEDNEMAQALLYLLDGECDNRIKAYSDFFKTLAPDYSLKERISKFILTNDNVFTRAAAAGEVEKLKKPVIDAVKSDLEKLEIISGLSMKDIISCADDDEIKILLTLPKWETGNAVLPLSNGWKEQTDELIAFHRENGYGMFAQYSAFKWRDEELVPITSLNKIRLDDLKSYESQKNTIVENTVSFIEGYPANNILLHGARGTGKSSTVHAILNEYRNRSLRMIEISKSDIDELSLIREMISSNPMKFIIFIDDLSFDSHEDSFGELKAALEGSLSGRQGNSLIYATSNRRHLIKENYSDRENDIHYTDTMQEELSLSDRFGLSVYFDNPDKNEYLDIVVKIADDRKIKASHAALEEAAELWARRRGGRSPRCARQFIDYVESCEKRNINW